MRVHKKSRTMILVMGVVLSLLLVSSAFGDTSGVRTRGKTGIGRYLTDSEGMALYINKNDPYMESTCTGDCALQWTPFYGTNIVSPLLDAEHFGEITRDDGTKQTTYKGRPLYYYSEDTERKDMKGHGFKKIWSLVRVKGLHSKGYVDTLSPNPSPRSNNI